MLPPSFADFEWKASTALSRAGKRRNQVCRNGIIATEIPPFTHAYFNVMVPREEHELFLSPGMTIKLSNGEDVLFAGLVTQNGVGSSLVVAGMDKTASKSVPCEQLAELVRPVTEPDHRGRWEHCKKLVIICRNRRRQSQGEQRLMVRFETMFDLFF